MKEINNQLIGKVLKLIQEELEIKEAHEWWRAGATFKKVFGISFDEYKKLVEKE